MLIAHIILQKVDSSGNGDPKIKIKKTSIKLKYIFSIPGGKLGRDVAHHHCLASVPLIFSKGCNYIRSGVVLWNLPKPTKLSVAVDDQISFKGASSFGALPLTT